MPDLHKIDDFINNEHIRINDAFGDRSYHEYVLLKLGKLMEESGELANEIMIHVNYCRPEKKTDNHENLELEYADCLISLLLLGRQLGIKPWDAVAQRMKILQNRLYK